MLRTGSKGLAAATLLLDALKGAAAVLIAQLFWPGCGQFRRRRRARRPSLSGLAQVPGGKGVATLLGILVPLLPIAALVYALIWVVAAADRSASRRSPGMAAAVSAPVSAALVGGIDLMPMLLGFALLVMWKHIRDNIARLKAGTEPRIGREGLSADLDRPASADPDARASARSPSANCWRASEAPKRRSRRCPILPRGAAGGRPISSQPRPPSARSPQVEALGARYLVLGQGLYPRLLAELDDAPPLLMAKGDLGLLERPLVAIVGARNASAAACRFARGLAHDLGRRGRGGRLRPGPRDRQRGA